MITKEDIDGLIFYFDTYDYDRGDLSKEEVDIVITALENHKDYLNIG